MKFSGVVLSILGLLLVLVPDACLGEVCTSCKMHIQMKPSNAQPASRRGRRARRDIVRAWPVHLRNPLLRVLWTWPLNMSLTWWIIACRIQRQHHPSMCLMRLKSKCDICCYGMWYGINMHYQLNLWIRKNMV